MSDSPSNDSFGRPGPTQSGPRPALAAGYGRQDLDEVAIADRRVDCVSAKRFAVDEYTHEAAELVLAIEDELAKARMLRLDGFDTHPYGAGVDLDETKTARRSPVARGNLYLRHFFDTFNPPPLHP